MTQDIVNNIKLYLDKREQYLKDVKEFSIKKQAYMDTKSALFSQIYPNIVEMVDLCYQIETNYTGRPKNYYAYIQDRRITIHDVEICEIGPDYYVVSLSNMISYYKLKVPFDMKDKQKYLNIFKQDVSVHFLETK